MESTMEKEPVIESGNKRASRELNKLKSAWVKLINFNLDLLNGLFKINIFYAILTILVCYISALVNAKLFTTILVNAGAVESITALDLPEMFVKFTSVAYLSFFTALFLEGFIALSEVTKNKLQALLFTLLSSGVIYYSWYQAGNHAEYGRLVIGILLVFVTLAISSKVVKKKASNWEQIDILTRLQLLLKFKTVNKRFLFFKKPIESIDKLNFKHLKNVYGIKQDSLKKVLIKQNIYDAKYLKQMPAERKKSSKGEGKK
jgi:hypothetical protein